MFHESFNAFFPRAGHESSADAATPPSVQCLKGTGTMACTPGAAVSSRRTRHGASRRKSLGQGMTEYIVIVALVGVAAIGVYSFLGQSIRGATSGIALEIAGESAEKGIKAAKDAADKAVSAAESKATLKNYNANNH